MARACVVTECSIILIRSFSFYPSAPGSPTASTFSAMADVSTGQPVSTITLLPILPPRRPHPTRIIYTSNIIIITSVIRPDLSTSSTSLPTPSE